MGDALRIFCVECCISVLSLQKPAFSACSLSSYSDQQLHALLPCYIQHWPGFLTGGSVVQCKICHFGLGLAMTCKAAWHASNGKQEKTCARLGTCQFKNNDACAQHACHPIDMPLRINVYSLVFGRHVSQRPILHCVALLCNTASTLS